MSAYGAHLISQYWQTAIETISFLGWVLCGSTVTLGAFGIFNSKFSFCSSASIKFMLKFLYLIQKIDILQNYFLLCPKYPPSTETSQKRGDKPFNKPRQTNLGHRWRTVLFVPSTIFKQMFEKKKRRKNWLSHFRCCWLFYQLPCPVVVRP